MVVLWSSAGGGKWSRSSGRTHHDWNSYFRQPHHPLYKPMKPSATMLILLSLFSMFRCKSSPAGETTTNVESEADRLAAYAQYPDALYPVKVDDKWGYINRKGETVIAPAWDEADDFYEGIARVGVIRDSEILFGFIDLKGAWVIQPVYQHAGLFSEGYAYVSKADRYGYINRQGKEVIACVFEDAGSFHHGYAAIKKGGWTGFIDTTGAIVVNPQYTVTVHHPVFNEGLAPVFGADEQTGFIDSTGQFRISAQFESAGNFVDGLAWATWQQDDSAAEHGYTIKGGYIDTEGVYVIPPEYDFGWDFSDGYATVWLRSEDRMSKIWKVIDKEGTVVLDSLPYRNVGVMHEGLIPIQDEDMKWGFMNIKGEVIIAPQYAGINHLKNGLARMELGSAFDNSIVYINTKGEILWSEK